jgi:hypothetical protein
MSCSASCHQLPCMINQAAAALQQTHEYWLHLRIWSHNIVNCYSWLLTQLLIILLSTLITHSQLDPSPSSSSSPPPPPAPPPAVRHGHGIHSFRSFAKGTHMPLELGSYVATQRKLLVLLSHWSKCKLRCCCCCNMTDMLQQRRSTRVAVFLHPQSSTKTVGR